jgi:hypothetical protein
VKNLLGITRDLIGQQANSAAINAMGNIEAVKSQVAINAPRIAQLGNWPSHVSEMSLVHRIPDTREGKDTAPGFDAGIACCLDLIPRDQQRLSAILHGAYTPEAVEQIRRESKELSEADGPLNETVWWLAACQFCDEGDCDSNKVLGQIRGFTKLAKNKKAIRIAAYHQFISQQNGYHIVDGVAVALKDGGMQAAYVHGYALSIMPAYGTWFVGTFYESLGIPADFVWGDKKDSKDRPMSGPVFGSQQFVKCADFNELQTVLAIAREHLSSVKP